VARARDSPSRRKESARVRRGGRLDGGGPAHDGSGRRSWKTWNAAYSGAHARFAHRATRGAKCGCVRTGLPRGPGNSLIARTLTRSGMCRPSTRQPVSLGLIVQARLAPWPGRCRASQDPDMSRAALPAGCLPGRDSKEAVRHPPVRFPDRSHCRTPNWPDVSWWADSTGRKPRGTFEARCDCLAPAAAPRTGLAASLRAGSGAFVAPANIPQSSGAASPPPSIVLPDNRAIASVYPCSDGIGARHHGGWLLAARRSAGRVLGSFRRVRPGAQSHAGLRRHHLR